MPSFRQRIRHLVPILDHPPRAAPAKRRRQPLRQALQALEDHQRHKLPRCLDDHGAQAWRDRRNKGMGTPRRGSHSASGMRRLRRLEKHQEGLRSAATRQHSMPISQAIQDLSLTIADCIEKGPQLAELPSV